MILIDQKLFKVVRSGASLFDHITKRHDLRVNLSKEEADALVVAIKAENPGANVYATHTKMERWAPILDKLGINDANKRDWMCEYAEYHHAHEAIWTHANGGY